MPDQDWTSAPYVRVYVTLARDQPEVWAEDGLLAWYVRLLVGGDRYHPAPAPWPRDLPAETEVTLVNLGAIDRSEGGYLVHGMARLRSGASHRAYAGGVARAAEAARDQRGRLLARDAGPDAGRLNGGTLGEAAGRDAGPRLLGRQQPSDTHTQVVAGDPSLQSGSPATPSPVETRAPEPVLGTAAIEPDTEAAYQWAVDHFGPDDSDCSAADRGDAHRAENHMYWHGVGWRCRASEAADPRTFRERMDAHGGPHF